LKSDFSDPDAIRVGDDFYMVASDFHFVGMQVLHSKDLVNWQIINQIFHRLPIDAKYNQMTAYGQGTWAPSIRFHDGQFYVYVCTPLDGLFMWHTKDPAGKWSGIVTVKAVPQWEDPCPFWDDDGQAYLIHSHKGAGPLIVHRMSADGTQLLDDGKEIYFHKQAEGPKLYKRGGYYYVSFPESGVATGGQIVIRSKNIYGPYERKEVLPNGSPHQGGIVDLDNGESWFIGFKSTGFLGRISYLEPVKWGDDGWPVFGDNGRPVQRWRKPNVGRQYPIERPPTSDDFDAKDLSPIWQWNHNPVDDHWSLSDRPGWLRLRGLPAEQLSLARNTLTEKLSDENGTIDVRLDASHLADGQRAGFTFISGDKFGWVGVEQTNGERHIAWEGGQGPALTSNEVWLRGTYHGDTARLSYCLDGKSFTDTKTKFALKFAFWKGARIGIFTYGGDGAADFDYVHYRYADEGGQ
ncbi:MAG TPA: glycoside hydrolase 43 family protein, partial [Tepidisphaeraceae bacterium]|nr:glycoside hydrolase 43 family protein [Tepidisphaeraceae bacterium]